MQQKHECPLRIFYSITSIGCTCLLFFAMLWLCQRSTTPLRAQAIHTADRLCGSPSYDDSPATCHSPLATPTLLAIYALAFDNEPGSPSNLSAYYTPTVQSIVSATAAADRVAVILADLDGYGDTHVLIVQNGVVVPVAGLPVAGHLGVAVTLDPALHEYNMADGWYLGNFIRWARQLYPASQTIFSFVGHGAPLTPQLQPLTEGIAVAEPTPTPPGTPTPADELSPLPPRWGAHSDLTDYHAASLISVRALAQALSIGTANGANPLAVVDLLHCFSATIEELYEVHPYARTIIAAPNYTYAQPAMLGAMLAMLDPAQPPSALAQALVTGYDNLLPPTDHPRLFIAVDGDKVAPIKVAWDETAGNLLDAWTSDPNTTRTRLLTAYNASAKYDTTICQPQEWQLAPPDALSDMADFAGHLGAAFGVQSPVGAWAMTTTQTISAAIIARHRHDGAPWFADVSPPPTWTFPAAGIALFTDFAPALIEKRPQFSWQAAWYTYTVRTGNRYPYAFIQPASSGRATWADLFSRFWTTPITSTAGCIQGFVNGRGAGSLWVTDLSVITSTVDSALFFSATVYSAEAATNPLLRFRVYQAAGSFGDPVFEQVVASGYLGAASQRKLQSSIPWQPANTSIYTVEATIDVDNRFTEVNEADNRITLTLPINVRNPVYLPVVAQ